MAISRFWVHRRESGETWLMHYKLPMYQVYADLDGTLNIVMVDGWVQQAGALRQMADAIEKWFREERDALQAEGAPGPAQAERDG